MGLTDSDRSFLVKLDAKLWPKKARQNGIVLRSESKLTKAEWSRVEKIVDSAGLICTMFAKGMFGGYGIDIYEPEDPVYPGVPLSTNFLLRVIEDNLPAPKGTKEKTPGCGLDHAWTAFSKLTHTKKMRAATEQYKLPAPREQSHYWY